MTQFTKAMAGQVYGYDYKVTFQEITWKCIGSSELYLKLMTGFGDINEVHFSEIGVSAFILARPWSDLTKDIPGIGVPIKNLECHTDDKLKLDRDDLLICSGENWQNNLFGAPMAILEDLKQWNFPVNIPDGFWKDLNEFNK